MPLVNKTDRWDYSSPSPLRAHISTGHLLIADFLLYDEHLAVFH